MQTTTRPILSLADIHTGKLMLMGTKIYVTSLSFSENTLDPDVSLPIVAAGADLTKQSSMFKAEMELFERYSWITAYKRFLSREIRWIKGTDFDSKLLSFLSLFKKFDQEKTYPAVKFYNLEGDERFFPANLFFYIEPWEEEIYLQTTIGCSAHTDIVDSLYSSVIELVERDSVNTWWYMELEPLSVYHVPQEYGDLYATLIPSVEGNVVMSFLLPSKRYKGFLAFAGADVSLKNAKVKSFLESALHLPMLKVIDYFIPKIESVQSITSAEEIYAYTLNQDASQVLSSILNKEKVEEVEIDFEREPLTKERKLKTVSKLFKKYDLWYREITHPSLENVTVTRVVTTDLVPFLNPFELINHPRLGDIKRSDPVPLA